MNRSRVLKRLVFGGVAAGGGSLVALWALPKWNERRAASMHTVQAATAQKADFRPLPSREAQIDDLASGYEFDVLVIGGGATGAGVALDSVSRGLKTAMVEKFDFAAGTSSRSTKLIHGGVRYLQKAIMQLDREQYNMVSEALSERANLLDIAPHLAYPLPIMLPVYKWWQVPYYWVGIKAYDLVSGRQILKSSYLLSKASALELFPMLKKDKLKAALVYYDGQHDDARMCLSIAMTAAKLGASVANYTEVKEIIHGVDENGKKVVKGAKVQDNLTGKTFNVRAKCVINATGPYTDFIRTMDDPQIPKICAPSSGIHIVLPDYYSPAKMGLLDPSTSDGRVIFFLPWQNSTMAGTTDLPCDVTDNPGSSEEEVQFILQEIRNYLSPDVNVRRGDVLSAWSGIRPLVRNPNAKDTQSIARNHIIEVSDQKLITIAGGKWTTYRSMAEETMDEAVKVCNLEPKSTCRTKGLLLDGAHDWTPTCFIQLIQNYGFDSATAEHLAGTYGDMASDVAKLASLTGHRFPVVGKKLHADYQYIEAEVIYACREYARHAIDIISRRTRLAFLNIHATEEALPRIVDIMAEELGWTEQQKKTEYEEAIQHLNKEMGRNLKGKTAHIPINFSKEELNTYVNRFKSLDSGNKGFITIEDLRKYFKSIGKTCTNDQLTEIICEVDVSTHGQVDLGEYLQLMSALKRGDISNSRLVKAAEGSAKLNAISTTRSCGGL